MQALLQAQAKNRREVENCTSVVDSCDRRKKKEKKGVAEEGASEEQKQ